MHNIQCSEWWWWGIYTVFSVVSGGGIFTVFSIVSGGGDMQSIQYSEWWSWVCTVFSIVSGGVGCAQYSV